MKAMHPSDLSINDFNYELPAERIAEFPLKARDQSKLLVFRNGSITDANFKNISDHLTTDHFLIFNNTKVLPARLIFQNDKEATIEIFCLEQESVPELGATCIWKCFIGNLKKWKEPFLTKVVDGLHLHATVKGRREDYFFVEFSWQPEGLHFYEVLEKAGSMPIPPYLNRDSNLLDQERYQTVFSKSPGSVAAPTAGLHFTSGVLHALEQKKVESMELTLHVGAGTFKPVKAAQMKDHYMHSEWINIGYDEIEELRDKLSKKIIAVGTTSLRAIETLYWLGVKTKLDTTSAPLALEQWEAYSLPQEYQAGVALESLLNWMKARNLKQLSCKTGILIAPPYELKIASGLITNFHQPKSTLLLLVAAVTGDSWRFIYHHALTNGYRFLSYGDSSLLLK
jgi:S-adenosylmethionine:tRNA ribosyltransferase-isomerase